MVGIYRFYFETNEQTYNYVGSSVNIEQRWKQHMNGLNESYDKYLDGGVGAKGIKYQLFDSNESDEVNTMYDKVIFILALNDIPFEQIKFEVIQEVNEGDLEEIELEHIIKFKSEIFGFNNFNWRIRNKGYTIDDYVKFFIMNQNDGIVVPWVLCDERLDGAPNIDPSNKNKVSIEIADSLNKYSHWGLERETLSSIVIPETDKYEELSRARNDRLYRDEVISRELLKNEIQFNQTKSKSGSFIKRKTIKIGKNAAKYQKVVNKYIDKGWEILSTNKSETTLGWRK